MIPSAVSLRRAGVEQPYQVKRMIGESGTCCSRPILILKMGNIQGFVSVVNLWGQVRTPRELFLVSRTGDAPHV